MIHSLQKLIEDKSIPEPNSGCWLWLGAVTNGYWWAYIKGMSERAHRVSWRAYRGDIPQGHYICHGCDNRMCVNPDHLFLGTPADNNHDMIKKGRFRAPHTNGSRHGNSKLSEAIVIDIFMSKDKRRTLSERYGIAMRHVDGIRRGERWAHLTSGLSRGDSGP